MASRDTIIQNFRTELINAVGSTGSGRVADDDISQQFPEHDEDLPAVVFEDFSTTVRYNQGSAATPTKLVKNNSDEIIDEEYTDYERVRFDVTAQDSDGSVKDTIYEEIREQFLPYSMWKDVSTFHSDVRDIDVGDVQSIDNSDTEPTMRGDLLTIDIEFKRTIERFGSQGTTGDPIKTIDHEVTSK